MLSADDECLRKGKENGADIIIRKPLLQDQFKQNIMKILI